MYFIYFNIFFQTFRGNTDQSTPVTNKFEQPIRARFIRIRPINYVGYPAMSIELIGCRSRFISLLTMKVFNSYPCFWGVIVGVLISPLRHCIKGTVVMITAGLVTAHGVKNSNPVTACVLAGQYITI